MTRNYAETTSTHSLFAPIAIFAYNRLEHLMQAIKALSENQESLYSELYIFLDGPKTNYDEMLNKEILNYINKIVGFKNVFIRKSEINQGLLKSITLGVSEVLSKHNKIIVLEDDIVVSKYFLDFMNSGLNLYENDSKVASIHGYVYPVKEELPNSFFLRGSDCWGWATWRRAWKKYNNNANILLDRINIHDEKNMFDYNGYGGYIKMLKDAIDKRNDSWAIRWYASTFLEDMYTLYPGKSLVNNIGLDGSGTHKEYSNQQTFEKVDYRIEMGRIPIQDSKKARQAFLEYFKSRKIVFKIINKIILIIQKVKYYIHVK